MKVKLFSLFLVLTQILSAQTFTETPQTIPFEGVLLSSIAFADVDGDNDQDVLITGENSSFNEIAKLYRNDGMGNFTEETGTPFEGVVDGSIAFADVDADNDQDVFITGLNSSSAGIAKLYSNDGTGNFTEKAGTPFEGIADGSIAFVDVDGDNDEDVLITGRNGSGARIAKMYTNDGTGNFTEKTGTPFEGVVAGSIAFADVDGDNDQDVLITGWNGSGARIAKLYTNDGTGNFIEKTGTPFEGVWISSIAFADVDGDNDHDVLIAGSNGSGARIAKLYTNDGTGNFTEETGTPFEGVTSGSVAFADVYGDNDHDVLITGENSSGVRIAKLYTNDGTGSFTEKTGTPFEGVKAGSLAFADVEGDNDQDVLITGWDSSGVRIAKLYTNNGVVSSIEGLNIGISLDFILFTNPSTSSTLFLRYDSAEMGEVAIRVYDINGRLLFQKKEYAGNGQHTFAIDIASLINGNYFIELDNGKRKGVAKFIVQ